MKASIHNKIKLYLNANYHRDKKKIVFGAWMGQKFADNPKFLFLETVKSGKFDALWVTKNPDVYSSLKGQGLPVEMDDSEQGIEFQKNAMFFVICTGVRDINQDYIGGATIINQWHGVPLKKVMWDDNINPKFNWFTYRLKTIIDYIPLRKMYVLSTSDDMQKIMMRSFKKSKKWAPILGQVRNDLFFSEEFHESINLSKFKGRRIITYMPTHRNEGKSVMNIGNLIDLNAIDALCKKYGYVFVIKKHFYHANEDISYTNSFEYILDITREGIDAQEMMKYSDVLITDYSSCYIDYLLLNRPILFYAYDLDQYLKKDRKMNFSYEEAAAGPIIQEREALSKEIEKVMLGIDDYRDLRHKVKHIFYNDETSAYSGTKVLEFIQNL